MEVLGGSGWHSIVLASRDDLKVVDATTDFTICAFVGLLCGQSSREAIGTDSGRK